MAALSLPPDFKWGFATASYQIEGSATADSRGPSIWDTFTSIPGKIADGSSGSVACDSYVRSGEDVALLKQLGAKCYRFSISWSRVIPLGGRDDPVNQAGLDYYSNLVDALLKEGIEPVVTLYHWDLPQKLQDRYGGLLCKEEFAADFESYAGVVFERLKGRVKLWVTFNEPWCSSILGFSSGVFAPGRSSDRAKCAEGDSSTEPWTAGHTQLIAHARAVRLWRSKYKERYGGEIGITLNGDWAYPWDPQDPLDIAAAQRKLEFSTGWFADPIYHGDYPDSMRQQLGTRLPSFTAEEAALVKGSNDFYGMNLYSSDYVRHVDGSPPSSDFLGNVETSKSNKAGDEIGPETECEWLRPDAKGFHEFLKWITERYGKPAIYVTENGTSVKGENELSIEDALQDELRVEYFRTYIRAMAQAVCEDGVDVRGYMAWSLLDNFEWADGYKTRFGVTYIDYANGQQRYPKKSSGVVGEVFASLIRKE